MRIEKIVPAQIMLNCHGNVNCPLTRKIISLGYCNFTLLEIRYILKNEEMLKKAFFPFFLIYRPITQKILVGLIQIYNSLLNDTKKN